MDFLIINGKIITQEEVNFSHYFWSEPLILSQKFWFGYGGIPLFDDNIEFLCKELQVLNLTIPDFLKNKRELFRISKRMLNKNKFYRSGIINMQLFLIQNKIEFAITSQAFQKFDFSISKKGLLVDFSQHKKYSRDPLNPYPFYNALIWQIESSALKDGILQNLIILNEKGMICEAIASNIFMIKENVLITPSPESGCFSDSIRKPILESARDLKLEILELSEIKTEHIFEMDEIFLANEENGIQWILGVHNKRFVHRITNDIHEKLNDLLKAKVD